MAAAIGTIEEPQGDNILSPPSTSSDVFLIGKAPPTIHYIPNFITLEEEERLLEHIGSAPKPKWEYLSNRRLQNWGGIVGKKALIPDDNMPEWLTWCIDKIAALEFTFPVENKPNHVLINEYLPGQGIMPHTDGPAFFPTVSTISLGSHTLLDFYKTVDENHPATLESRYVGSMLLERRSLILIKDSAYKDMMHGIAERATDTITEHVFNLDKTKWSIGDELTRDTRVSLTIRNVPKVSKLGLQSILRGKAT
uniref:Fe2OG dioxygenase domain-containing protein n=1 Tax=Plectus sambesii TaxID=2011161 RepID=A0A914UZJ6_9BILA